jgi:hypothetical protein
LNLHQSPAQSQADTDPSVTDLNPDTIRLDFRGDHNPPTGGCALDGVGKKVQQCLLDRLLII